ncbi:S1C family serine protease [Desulfoscipio gibsoniae]
MTINMKNNEQEAMQTSFGYGSDSIADDAVQDDECVDDYFNDGCCDESDDGELISSRPSLLLRIVALITALAFLGLVAATSWPVLQAPVGDLISRSLQLEKDIDIQRLQAAVVQIKVVARKQGALAPVEQKSGTGFNIDSCGIVVTNHHVIEDALNMAITFPDGKVYKAVSWVDRPEFDLAVVTLQADDLPVVPLNADKSPVPGDKIRVVGNPLGLNNIVAEGRVEQYLMVGGKPDRVFSISAPVYPGNSGSPVFDREGRVVGVVFGNLHRQVDGADKVTGLAIPVQEVLNLHR